MKTCNEIITERREAFRALSPSRKNTLRRDARAFIYANPGCADNSTFWRGLSARQVLETQ